MGQADEALVALRRRGVRVLAAGGWVYVAILATLAATGSASGGWPAVALGATLNLLPSLVAWRGRGDPEARQVVALSAALFPALLLFILRDRAGQEDMHMLFFVDLAALTLLCDWRPIALASVLVAIHHLLLMLFVPDWVFEGGGSYGRLAVHAAAIGAQFAVLGFITFRLRAMLRAEAAAQAESRRAAEAAEAALAAARTAEATSAETRAAAARQAHEAEQRRRADLLALAAAFEDQVQSAIASVGAAAHQLGTSASQLTTLSSEAGERATEVANTAARSADAATDLAGGVSSVAQAMADMTAHLDRQAALGRSARERSEASDGAVRALGERTANVGTLVELIRTVATQTNLLALNATLEAARAGAAGNGFKVVAGEVKALARRAADATNTISGLLEAIRFETSAAGSGLNDVAEAVATFAGLAEDISGAIARQRRAAAGIEEHAHDAANGARRTAADMAAVVAAVGAADQVSGEVRSASLGLLGIADDLASAAQRFTRELRAA